MSSKEPKLVLVHWNDASGGDGWIDTERLVDRGGKLAKIETVGYLVHEDKESVTLTMAKDITNNNSGAYIHIPKSCITKRKVLKE